MVSHSIGFNYKGFNVSLQIKFNGMTGFLLVFHPPLMVGCSAFSLLGVGI